MKKFIRYALLLATTVSMSAPAFADPLLPVGQSGVVCGDGTTRPRQAISSLNKLLLSAHSTDSELFVEAGNGDSMDRKLKVEAPFDISAPAIYSDQGLVLACVTVTKR